MNRYVPKAELLRRLQREHARFEAMLARLTGEQMIEPNVVGNWSIKDVIAHFIAHEQFALEELQCALRGERPEVAHYAGDAFNARVVMASRFKSVDDVKSTWDRSYRQVVAAVTALSDADFDPASPVVQALGDSIDGALGNNSYDHYAEHQAEIEAWLRKTSG